MIRLTKSRFRTVAWLTNIAFCTLAASCASIEPPPRPAETRIEYKPYPVDKPVPCFTEAERPIRKPPTPVDIDKATASQLVAAMAADDINDQLYAQDVDRLFALCMKRIADGTANTTVGGK